MIQSHRSGRCSASSQPSMLCSRQYTPPGHLLLLPLTWHIHMYEYIYIYLYMYAYVCIYMYIYTCMYMYIYTRIHIYVHIYICHIACSRQETPPRHWLFLPPTLRVCMNIYLYVYIYVYIRVYVYVYIYTYTYICTDTYKCYVVCSRQ